MHLMSDSPTIDSTLESPCVKVCVIDPASGLCRGCARSLDEIARWSAMSAAERARIMVDLPARRRGAAAGSAG